MVAVEYGIDIGRIHPAFNGLAVEILYCLAWLKGIIARETVGTAREWQAETCGVEVIAHGNLDVKRAQEHVAGGETLVGHLAKGARVARRQAHGRSLIALGKRGGGVVHGQCAAHRDAETVIGRSPVIAQRAVVQRVVPHVVTLVGGLYFIMFKVVEQRVGYGDHRRHHTHAVMALPLAVL